MKLTDTPNLSVGNPDLITTLSLVQSNGYWGREFFGGDTSKQLSNQDAINLGPNGFGLGYVGRYLTGTVGVPGVPKYLTRQEAQNIINAGMNTTPIYQNNYPINTYYTESQDIVMPSKQLQLPVLLGFRMGQPFILR